MADRNRHRWPALGGGGYCPVRVAPRVRTHLLAIVSGRDIDPATSLPAEWLQRAAAAAPDTPLPADMSDGTPPAGRLALRAHGLSPESITSLIGIMDQARKFEGLPMIRADGDLPSRS